MHAKINETPRPQTPPEDTYAAVTPVGTFAEGQSLQGSFPVVIGAEVGNFASGQTEEDETGETV